MINPETEKTNEQNAPNFQTSKKETDINLPPFFFY